MHFDKISLIFKKIVFRLSLQIFSMQGEYLTNTDILLEVFPMSTILDSNLTTITNIDFLLVYYESSASYLLNKDEAKNICDKICAWRRIFFSHSYMIWL